MAMAEGAEGAEGQERLVAMTSCTAQSPQKMGMPSCRDRLEVAINGFDPGATYHFTLYARAHLPILGGSEWSDAESLSKLDFQEVARSESFQWPSRLSEEWSCTVDWSLPFPRNLGQMRGIVLLTFDHAVIQDATGVNSVKSTLNSQHGTIHCTTLRVSMGFL